MPLQSRINFKKFQASLLVDSSARAELAGLVIPHECEYCHGKESMKIHGWYQRYAVDPYNGEEYLLLVPLFVCTHCGHCIRVLPYEHHPWSQYLSYVIKKALSARLRDGSWRSGILPSKRLARKWYESFMKRWAYSASLSRGSPLEAIEKVPNFTILFRRTTICEKEIGHPPYFPADQRKVILSVYQSSV